jgi:nucleotide-binding universal stress UspA family protein
MTGETPGAGDSVEHGGAFRRILVGFDGSDEAQGALRTALELAAEVHGDVRVLLVVRPPAHAETPEELATAAAAERDNLSRGLSGHARGGGATIDTRVVLADDPARALAEHAEGHGFDLVVVGSHGREQVTHRGIGHSLESLLRHHPCPVLVV